MALYLMLALLVLAVTGIGREPLLALFRVDPALWRDAGQALFLVALSLGFTLIYTPYRAALFYGLRHYVQHYTHIIFVLARAGLIVGGFAFWEPRLLVWALAGLVASIVAFLIQRFEAHRHCPSLEVKGSLVTRRGFRDLASLGVYTSVTQLSNWLELQSAPLIISFFLGTAAVAHFTPALVLATVLLSLSGAFLIQLQPLVTRAHVRSDFAMIGSILMRSTRYSLLLTGGAAVGVGALSFALIPVWLGEGFRDTATVLLLWCVTTLVRSGVGGAFPIFLGTGKLRVVAGLNAALAVAGMAATVYFVGFTKFGVVGATFGVVATQVARSALYIIYVMRISRVSLSQYFRESYLGPMVSLALLAATAIGTQLALEADEWVELSVGGGLSLLVFGALAWTIGLNTQDRGKALAYLRTAADWATTLLAGRTR
jgi:O-antigen/teichoic acid export membrane protein